MKMNIQKIWFPTIMVALFYVFILQTSLHAIFRAKSPQRITREFTISNQGVLHFHSPHILSKMKLSHDRYRIKTIDGYEIVLTLDPEVQRKLERKLNGFKVDYGTYVSIHPQTGKILTLLGYRNRSTMKTDGYPSYLKASYPAASLFKIVTATAAVEKANFEPQDKIKIPGRCQHIRRKNWIRNVRKDKRAISLANAFGKSCNIAFGRIALYETGYKQLQHYANLFYFNRPIPFELPLKVSTAIFPPQEEVSAKRLAEIGAGFGDIEISPVHAALLSATIANKGVMMTPYIVDWIEDKDGLVIYQGNSKILNVPISAQTAEKLSAMMEKTVTNGTSWIAFKKRGFPRVKTKVGGKTGTLTGYSPLGKYTWFSGFAPIANPEIAISALVVMRKRFIIKGSHLARIGIASHMKYGQILENQNHILMAARNE